MPRTRLPHIIRRTAEIGRKHQIRIVNVAHAGDGNIHPILLFDERDRGQVERAVAAGREILVECIAAGGSITAEHGIGVEKIGLMDRLFAPSDLQAMRHVRQALDPSGLLNPGKLVPEDRRRLARGEGAARGVAPCGLSPPTAARSSAKRVSSGNCRENRNGGLRRHAARGGPDGRYAPAGARLASTAKKVAGAAGEYKQVPDRVMIRQAFPAVKHGARGVGRATGEQQDEAGVRQDSDQRPDRDQHSICSQPAGDIQYLPVLLKASLCWTILLRSPKRNREVRVILSTDFQIRHARTESIIFLSETV